MKTNRDKAYKLSVVLLLIYLVAVLFLSLHNFSDDDRIYPKFPLMDKIGHWLMMVPLAVIIFIIYRIRVNKRISTSRLITISLFCGTILGIVTEVLQEFLTTYRTGSFYDLLADIIGVLTGCLIVFWAGTSIERKMGKIIDYEHN